MILRILGLILGLATCVAAGSLKIWADSNSLLIVLISLICAFLLSGKPLILTIKGGWSIPLSEPQALKAAIGYKMMRYCSFGAALIGAMIGWLMVLANLHDPTAIGPAMSLALLSSLYSFFFAFFIFIPSQANLERSFGFNDSSIVKSSLLCVVIALIHVFLTFLTLSLLVDFNGAIETKQAFDVGLFTLLNPTSLLLISGVTCSILLSSRQNIGNMFSALFVSNATAKKLLEAAAAWRTIAAASLGVGTVLTLIGMVHMLMAMDEAAKLPSALANNMLTILYGLVIAFVVAMPIQSRLEQRAESAG